jgi:putative heme-binding domain-containing protein
VGRGSPTWGRFYEHTQFPGKFRNAFLVCDYRWKRESNDQYATTGRLVTFFLRRKGATWAADMETLARPKPGAHERNGKLINFALVDVEVAPDGSLFVSDHNQGIWRIYFGAPGPVRNPFPRNSRKADPLQELLSLPQPGAEWSRVREEAIRSHGGADLEMQVRAVAANKGRPLEHRLRAIRLLESNFAALSDEFIELLARDKVPEVRGQAAYLLGIRGKNDSVPLLCKMAGEGDPFVRRRAAEALTRFGSAESTDALIERLGDSSRLIRYTAMIALAHQPTPLFFNKAAVKREPETRMRALVAASLRGELPPLEDIQRVIDPLLDQSLFPEERLDLLRVLGIFHNEITNQPVLHARVAQHLADAYPGSTRDLRWEQIRLIGQYQVSHAFSRLLRALETERYPVTQFHIAQTIARLPAGWSIDEEERLFKWFASTQRGWFAEFSGKGVEFPEFWTTVLSEFAAHHPEIMMRNFGRIDLGSPLGTVAINLVAHEPDGTKRLIGLYGTQRDTTRVKVLAALGGALPSGEIAGFCRSQYAGTTNSELKGALVKTLARQSSDPADIPLFIEGMAQRQIEVVRACASALARLKPKLDETQAAFAIRRMAENNELCRTIEPLLVASTRENPPGLDQPLSDSVRAIRVQFWRAWFEKQFNKPFPAVTAKREKSDSELIEFLLSDRAKGGDPIRGGKVYELAQCNTCHGGGAAPGREGRLFGPDLAGATRRLTPREFAESLVYPSRQVAERYRAWEITLKDGTLLTGFITEQNDAAVTLADRNQVQRIARGDIESIRPQTTSLMPDHLLNGLGSEQIRDLLAFLDQGPASPRR